MRKQYLKIFVATLVALLSAIAIPLDLVITRNGYRALGILTSSAIGLVGVVAGVFALRWARASGSGFSRLFIMAMFGWAILLTFIGGILVHYGTGAVCRIEMTHSPSGKAVQRSFCTVPSVSTQHAIGVGLLILALLLVFVSLVTVPSTEQELLRRIDLEASSIAVGLSFFFFLGYATFKEAFKIPAFSNGIAIWTLIVSYLFARLVLTIRYR